MKLLYLLCLKRQKTERVRRGLFRGICTHVFIPITIKHEGLRCRRRYQQGQVKKSAEAGRGAVGEGVLRYFSFGF